MLTNILMKKNLFIVLFGVCCLCVNAQTVLHKSTNLPRVNDRISKQEIKYFPVGETGLGKVWQIDHLSPVKEQYDLVYIGNDSLFIGIEHRTQYKYKVQGDSLWKVGVENLTTYQEAICPELLAVYPMRLGDCFESFFGYTGEYQHAYGMQLLGKTTVAVDAEGTLVIEGDTIPDVLRVHTKRKFIQDLNLHNLYIAAEDSVGWLCKFHPDSILYHISEDTLVTQTDTYCWYVPGYRYPILETVENSLIRRGIPDSHFRTAFYYPPVEQYYALDEDMENLRSREETLIKQQSEERQSRGSSFSLEDALGKCRFYQEESNLTVEYSLNASCNVEISLYTVQGELLAIYPKKELRPGQYYESITIDPSLFEHYVLRLVVNGKVYGEKL